MTNVRGGGKVFWKFCNLTTHICYFYKLHFCQKAIMFFQWLILRINSYLLFISDCLSTSFCNNGDRVEEIGGQPVTYKNRFAGKLHSSSLENCECQCDKSHPTFREDERECVNDLPGNFSILQICRPSTTFY